jgi:glycosyltransferase involved in cell wall biosynthesis
MPREGIAALLPGARLLIQASRFEPFGLTVGEALACGVPVIATDEVGAAEDIDPEVLTVVPAGDVAALEAAVRAELLRGPLDEERRARCRSEASRRYSPEVVGALSLAALRRAAEGA